MENTNKKKTKRKTGEKCERYAKNNKKSKWSTQTTLQCRGIEPTTNFKITMHAATLKSECRGIGWDFLRMSRHWEVNAAALSLLLGFSEFFFLFSFSFLFFFHGSHYLKTHF